VGSVLASVAGARRTSTSFDRFREETQSGHLIATFPGPFDGVAGGGAPNPELARQIARLPGVESVGRIYSLAMYPKGDDFGVNLFASIDGHVGTRLDRSRLLEGRYADPGSATEVTVSEATANSTGVGVGVGDVFTLVSFTPEQIARFAVDNSFEADPEGPTVRLQVVGVERRPFDLTTEGQSAGVSFLTPAFYEKYHDQIGTFLGEYLRVRLEDGAAGIRAFTRAVRDIPGGEAVGFRNESFDTGGITDSIDVLTAGLLLFAAIAALAALVALGQAISRQAALAASGHESLRALGMSRRQHVVALTIAALPAVVAGVVVGLVGAYAASSVMPLGIAARAEPNPGAAFDVLVLGLGGFMLVVLALALSAFAAWRAVRSTEPDAARRRSPVLSTVGTQWGLRPEATAGLRMAVDSGKGANAVPTRSAIAGAALAVAGVLAAVVFAASLDRLVATPSRFGWNWDAVTISDAVTGGHICTQKASVDAADRDVDGLAVICMFRVVLGGRPVQAMGVETFRGKVVPTIVTGRAPRAADEVALGVKTLTALDREVGDIVTGRGPEGARRRYTIVGQVVFPTIGDASSPGDGSAFTGAGLDRLDVGSDDNIFGSLLRFGPGVDHVAATKRFASASEQGSTDPNVPEDIKRIQEVESLPPVLGALLVVLALLAVGHALVTGVRRRRRDLAVFKTLGFTRRQVFSVVAWNASTIAVLGALVGIPLGVVLGKIAWGLVAESLGVATDAAVGAVAIVAVVPAAILVANLLAVLPARAAARTRPAVALRSE
ncbi:MAG: FtsX-like permease family protein, partial [Acidimicrobiia bacterium]